MRAKTTRKKVGEVNVIRAAQNMVQIMMVKHDSKGRDDLYQSMKNNDIALSRIIQEEEENLLRKDQEKYASNRSEQI